MTKLEAIAAMQEGKKVRHRFFTPNEYVYYVDGVLTCENGLVIPDFWHWRSGQVWNECWEIVV